MWGGLWERPFGTAIRRFALLLRADRGMALPRRVSQLWLLLQGRVGQAICPWQCLYFLPLPQGQGSLRPTLGPRSAGSPSYW